MSEKIIKSADRVKDIGEVFTPKKTVDFMLDQPEIKAKVNSLTATFLEPSAGEGAFLVEILKRKLAYAEKVSKSVADMQNSFLLALSTLYGIELMEDNVKALLRNMNETFKDVCDRAFKTKDRSKKVLQSAQVIISANMVQGDTLSCKTASGEPIVFSEWKPLSGGRVQRTEQTFDSIVKQSNEDHNDNDSYEQLNLFGNEEASDADLKHYLPCKWEDIYQQRMDKNND